MSKTSRLAEKIVLITGGARNQGVHHGGVLVEHGARVMLTDVLDADGEREAATLREHGFDVVYHHLDVTRASDWAAAVEAARQRWGRIDVLVNNAALPGGAGLMTCNEAEWANVIAVNQTGPMLGIQHTAPLMLAQGSGSIINVSSVMGVVGMDFNIAYAVSKAALLMLTKCAAMTLAPTIRVNSLVLGAIDSDMLRLMPPDLLARRLASYPLGRAGTFAEASQALLFLASDESSFTTGAELRVDGGASAGVKQPHPAHPRNED